MANQAMATAKVPQIKNRVLGSKSRKPEPRIHRTSMSDQIAGLQRTIGNRAMERLMKQDKDPSQSLSYEENFSNVQPTETSGADIVMDFNKIKSQLAIIAKIIVEDYDLGNALSQTPRFDKLNWALSDSYYAIDKYLKKNEPDYVLLKEIVSHLKKVHLIICAYHIPSNNYLTQDMEIYQWFFKDVLYQLLVAGALELLKFKDASNRYDEALKAFKDAIQFEDRSLKLIDCLVICVNANINNQTIGNTASQSVFSKDNYSKMGYIQLPNSGVGYTSYNRDNNDNWGAPEFVKALIDVAANMHAQDNKYLVYIGDLSLKDGGYFEGHTEHQTGNAADLVLFYQGKNITDINQSSYDQSKCKKFVDGLKLAGFSQILFNGADIGATYCSGHDNHFHVGL